MENPIVKLDWPHINRRIAILGTKMHREFPGRDKIYGIPRGGAIVAGLLQAEGFTPVERPTDAHIAIDDIIDSGKTRDAFLTKYEMPFFGLVDKQGEDSSMFGNWIEFPWEEPGGRDIEDNLVRIIEYIGENPSRDGLKDTPARVVKSWGEIFGGYRMDPKEILNKSFQEEKYDQLVCLDNIEFYSTCEHHMLPFFGKAHVAYLPKNKVVGISKLARLVECFARRLQIQERLTGQIADALFDLTESNGVGVMIEAQHFCMICRGVHKQNSIMRTSALRGSFFTEPQLRQEFFSLIQRKAEA